jgi:predicted P-loop ATPase/GTPase
MANSLLKRLEQISKYLTASGGRTIGIRVPTALSPMPDSVESQATVAPETQAAVDEILDALNVTDADLVIEIRSFYTAPATNGQTEPVPVPLPQA